MRPSTPTQVVEAEADDARVAEPDAALGSLASFSSRMAVSLPAGVGEQAAITSGSAASKPEHGDAGAPVSALRSRRTVSVWSSGVSA